MRLKYKFISEYKNLKDFSLDFDNESFIDVFVGKNGSGGSKIIEISDSAKMVFAQEIIPALEKEHFEIFRPTV